MRAFCLNLYDDDDRPSGDVWLSAPEGRLLLDISSADRNVVTLSEATARGLRDWLDDYLAETEAAKVRSALSPESNPEGQR